LKLKVLSILNFYLYRGESTSGEDANVKVVTKVDGEDNKWIFSYFPEALCKRRWQEGCSLYFLLDEKGQPCSFAWFRLAQQHFVGEINKVVIYPYYINCVFDCITPTQYRGNGYYPKLIQWICNHNKSHPCMIYAFSSNIASNKGILKAEFKLSHKVYKFLKLVKVSPINKEQIKIYVKD